jgi:hypothetical protein
LSTSAVEVVSKSWLTGEAGFRGMVVGASFATLILALAIEAAVEPLLFVRTSVAGLPARLIPRVARIAASSPINLFGLWIFRPVLGKFGDDFVRGPVVTEDLPSFGA